MSNRDEYHTDIENKINRREALALGFTGLLSLASACSKNSAPHDKLLDGTTDYNNNYLHEVDVVIVGAGIAGIAAAEILVKNNKTVIVLEASSRVGGRLRTERSLGIPFDLGASWIHGIEDNPLTKLADEMNANTKKSNFYDITVYDEGGVRRSLQDFRNAENDFVSLLELVRKQNRPDISFENMVNNLDPKWFDNRLNKFFTSSYLTFDTGDLHKLSSTLFDEGEEFGGPEVIVADGYDRFAQHLAAGIDVRLNHPVSDVVATNNGVAITTDNKSFSSKYVLVAVPLGVLKSQNLMFDPSLPIPHKKAIESIGFNTVNKFLFVWDATFWDSTDFLAYTSQQSNIFNWFINFNSLSPNSHALLTFAYAEDARKSESMADEELIGLLMSNLRDMYGSTIPAPRSMLRSSWSTDPFTQGSYSFPTTETRMEHFETLATPVGRIHFAGEHTHSDYFSTVHGAYLSGLRAAQEILDRL